MSSAFYPQGMKSYNNHVPQGGYKSWKGAGEFSNPIGIAPGHIRPFTNKDPGNVFPTGFGLPRPLKHYRRGRSIKSTATPIVEPNLFSQAELDQINYNVHRYIKSSKGQSLGGGNGGTGLIQTLIETPGAYLIKDKNKNIVSSTELPECVNCEGISMISSWYPITNLTEKPEPVVTNPTFCCNEEYKARRRALPSSTNVKKNYYQTTDMYLYNRCQTFEQREFNFLTERDIIQKDGVQIVSTKAKPGSALAIGNLYVANCNPNGLIAYSAEQTMMLEFAKYILNNDEYTAFMNLDTQSFPATISDFVLYLHATLPNHRYLSAVSYMDTILFNPYLNPNKVGIASSRGCKRVYYKPNNPTFAQQGAVSSATRTFKLNVDAIETNAASLKGTNFTNSLIQNNPPNTSYIYKMKVPKCNPSTFVKRFQNPRICTPTISVEPSDI